MMKALFQKRGFMLLKANVEIELISVQKLQSLKIFFSFWECYGKPSMCTRSGVGNSGPPFPLTVLAYGSHGLQGRNGGWVPLSLQHQASGS